MNNPFDYIDRYDILIITIGMILRLFYSLNQKVKELGKEEFSLKKYFDARHIIRWLGHISASFGFLFTAPQFILQFGSMVGLDWLTSWPGLATFAVGFFGYDMIKKFEKIGEKIGIGIGDGEKMENKDKEGN